MKPSPEGQVERLAPRSHWPKVGYVVAADYVKREVTVRLPEGLGGLEPVDAVVVSLVRPDPYTEAERAALLEPARRLLRDWWRKARAGREP